MDLSKLRTGELTDKKEKTFMEKVKVFFLGNKITEEEKQLDKIKFYTYYEKGSGQKHEPLESTPNLLIRIRNTVVSFFEIEIGNFRENRIIAKRKKLFRKIDNKVDELYEKDGGVILNNKDDIKNHQKSLIDALTNGTSKKDDEEEEEQK